MGFIQRDETVSSAGLGVIHRGSGFVMNAPGAMTVVVKRHGEGLRIIHEHYSLQTP